jgi:DsbC/DsbD-like thiol-disulfide interchange protein
MLQGSGQFCLKLTSRIGFGLLLLTMIFVSLSFAAAFPKQTEVSLITDYDPSSVADKKFRIGVRFKMKPDWHIYWQYPGEFGLPTQIKFLLPAGVTAGELKWPAPQQFVQSGNQIGYGYSDQVVLFSDLTIPASQAKLIAQDFKAEVKWLNCSPTLCVPDSAELQLSTFDQAGAAKTELDHWQGHVPLSVQEGSSPLKISQQTNMVGDTGSVSLVLEWSMEHGKVEFFPALPKDLKIEDLFISQEGLQSLISFKVTRLRGVTDRPAQSFSALIRPAAGNEEIQVYSFDIKLK